MLKLKFQYFGHLMWRANSLEKTLMLGKIGCRRRGQQRMRRLDGIVVATRSGKQTHSEGQSDSGVQFITPRGPRQSLLLAKDPDQFL